MATERQQGGCGGLEPEIGCIRSGGCGRGWVFAAAVVLVLAAGCGRGEQKARGTQIIIDSQPEQGATVMIEGIERGLTPVTLSGMPPGWIEVLLKKERYKKAADRIQVKEGQQEKFVIAMEPLVGYLTVESEPAGAEVTLLKDGKSLGNTPLFRIALPIGEYQFDIKLPNYYPQTETITVKEDFQYDRKYILKPMEATLSVLSQPTGASIWINNQIQDRKTPAKFKLPPGLYRVSVYSKGYIQSDGRAELHPNEEIAVTLEMSQGEVPPGMVLVPAGPFIFGEDERSPDESPRREIVLEAFYIDKLEVTNDQFKKVFPSHMFPVGQEQFPVGGISWNQATAYAQAVGKRLPTEQEWEKAARGVKGNEYPWGLEFDVAYCNTQESENRGPVPVGKYQAGLSPYSCLDMAGNVYEWVENWYEAYPGNKLVTKDYGQIYRVLRGGSYTTTKFYSRCARRHFDRMDATRADYGLRCAKDVSRSVK
ncbi:MAG TPA: SUMF1/EgtB/PvdO family nonheme iron enzyme [Candidatus Hydrogenedentes bacterium]|mgnify:CR=1 FL=1|nr:SUMF1/EgtB/PvdO family nonheme iron enzyme [Candidatus Hydrogenedentota bacterium]